MISADAPQCSRNQRARARWEKVLMAGNDGAVLAVARASESIPVRLGISQRHGFATADAHRHQRPGKSSTRRLQGA